jgi:predicted small lipoprotein YifL
VSVFVLLVLSACGQKGDLYLPDIPPSPNLMDSEHKLEPVTDVDTVLNESAEIKKDTKRTESNKSLPATDAE